MTTFNISLTDEQARLVDDLTTKHGFANRSEFFRAILRHVSTQPKVAAEVASWPFTPPATKSNNLLLKEFKKTSRYSPEFLADLAEGLAHSSYFGK